MKSKVADFHGSFELTALLAMPTAWRTVWRRVGRTRWVEHRECLVEGKWEPATFYDAVILRGHETTEGIKAFIEKTYLGGGADRIRKGEM